MSWSEFINSKPFEALKTKPAEAATTPAQPDLKALVTKAVGPTPSQTQLLDQAKKIVTKPEKKTVALPDTPTPQKGGGGASAPTPEKRTTAPTTADLSRGGDGGIGNKPPSPAEQLEQVSKAGEKPAASTPSQAAATESSASPQNGERTYKMSGAIKRNNYNKCTLQCGDAKFEMAATSKAAAASITPRYQVNFGGEWLIPTHRQPYQIQLQGIVFDSTASTCFEDFLAFVEKGIEIQYDKYHQPQVPEKPAILDIQGTVYTGLYTAFHYSKDATFDMIYRVSVSFFGVKAERTGPLEDTKQPGAPSAPAPAASPVSALEQAYASAGTGNPWDRVLDQSTALFPNEATGGNDFATKPAVMPQQYSEWEAYAAATGAGQADRITTRPTKDYAYVPPTHAERSMRPSVMLPDRPSDAVMTAASRSSGSVAVPEAWSQVYDGMKPRAGSESRTAATPSFADARDAMLQLRGQTVGSYYTNPGYQFTASAETPSVAAPTANNFTTYDGKNQPQQEERSIKLYKEKVNDQFGKMLSVRS